VQELEDRLATLETAIKQVREHMRLFNLSSCVPQLQAGPVGGLAPEKKAPSPTPPSISLFQPISTMTPMDASPLMHSESSDDDVNGIPLYERLPQLDSDQQRQIRGLSSGYHLVESTQKLREEYFGKESSSAANLPAQKESVGDPVSLYPVSNLYADMILKTISGR
jgi:hypothetical protein